MAFDIKKIAIASGCTAVVVFALGRLVPSSDTGGYHPITSLSQLDQVQGVQEVQGVPNQVMDHVDDLSQSVTIENAKRLSITEFPPQLATPLPQLMEVAEQSGDPSEIELFEQSTDLVEPPVPPSMEVADLENDDLEIELFDEPSPLDEELVADKPMMDQPNLDQPELDEPAVDKATVDSMQATAPMKSKGIKKTNKSMRANWKSNPFISTNSPAFTPMKGKPEKTKFDVQPASMKTTGQAVRSLNEIEGIPALPTPAPAPAPAQPYVHASGSMVNSGASIVSTTSPIVETTPFYMTLSEGTAQKAVHHIEYGKSLIRRGATFAARNEFFSALRVIAEANDSMSNGNDFSRALTKAIRAMKEAEDFSVPDAQSFAVVDVPVTIESHKTKILTPVEARRISPRNAMQRYYAYAGQQLDLAGGRNVVTAEALYCLGKLHSVISSQQPANSDNLDISQAIVFHRSSLLSNPGNPSSANELGVLLAKSGSLEEATGMFKQSLISQPTPQGWSNLAITHKRLGEQQLAQMAQAEIAVAAQTTSIATSGIQWIDTPQFNAMAVTEFEPRIARKASPAVLPKANKNSEEEKPKASIAERIKEWF